MPTLMRDRAILHAAQCGGATLVLGLLLGLLITLAIAAPVDDCNSDEPGKMIAGCTEALAATTDSATRTVVLIRRGAAYRSSNDPIRAIIDLTEALRLDPKMVAIYVLRAEIYREQGQRKEALQDYESALRMDPNDADATSGKQALTAAAPGSPPPPPTPPSSQPTPANQPPPAVTTSGPTSAETARAADSRAEIVFWQTATRFDTRDAYEAYIKQYGEHGTFAVLAKSRLATLSAVTPRPDASRSTAAPPPHDCDRLAASPYDPFRPADVKGVTGGETLDAANATTSCEAALRAYPGTPRFEAQLARARYAALDYVPAREAAERAGAQEPLALTLLGVMHEYGQGVAPDYARAHEYYESAAALGYAPAQFDLGVVYEAGSGVAVDLEKSRHYFEIAAQAGYANALYRLGAQAETGRGGPKDLVKAKDFYERAASAGSLPALLRLGRWYIDGAAVPKSYAQARHYLEAALAIDPRNAAAMVLLGYLYHSWDGPEKDLVKAKGYYEAAIAIDPKQGVALPYLGHLYLTGGTGVPIDYGKARTYLEQAAALQYALALVDLAGMYEDAKGVPRDFAKARDYYRRAAELGNLAAMKKLAAFYQNATGGPKDDQQAQFWAQKAAAAGAR